MKKFTIGKMIIFLLGVTILSFIGQEIYPVLGILCKLSMLGIIFLLGYLLFIKLFR